MPTIAITATPMMIPSMVNVDRSLFRASARNAIFMIATNLLNVQAGSMNVGGAHLDTGATQTLVESDVTAIEREAPAVANAAPAAVLFSTANGIAFGYHPARKAARLDPIEVLRFE